MVSEVELLEECVEPPLASNRLRPQIVGLPRGAPPLGGEEEANSVGVLLADLRLRQHVLEAHLPPGLGALPAPVVVVDAVFVVLSTGITVAGDVDDPVDFLEMELK